MLRAHSLTQSCCLFICASIKFKKKIPLLNDNNSSICHQRKNVEPQYQWEWKKHGSNEKTCITNRSTSRSWRWPCWRSLWWPSFSSLIKYSTSNSCKLKTSWYIRRRGTGCWSRNHRPVRHEPWRIASSGEFCGGLFREVSPLFVFDSQFFLLSFDSQRHSAEGLRRVQSSSWPIVRLLGIQKENTTQNDQR